MPREQVSKQAEKVVARLARRRAVEAARPRAAFEEPEVEVVSREQRYAARALGLVSCVMRCLCEQFGREGSRGGRSKIVSRTDPRDES